MKSHLPNCCALLFTIFVAACGGTEESATDGIVAVTLTSRPTEIEFSQVQLSIEGVTATFEGPIRVGPTLPEQRGLRVPEALKGRRVLLVQGYTASLVCPVPVFVTVEKGKVVNAIATIDLSNCTTRNDLDAGMALDASIEELVDATEPVLDADKPATDVTTSTEIADAAIPFADPFPPTGQSCEMHLHYKSTCDLTSDGVKNSVRWMQFSPDGRWLASAGDSKTRLWRVKSGWGSAVDPSEDQIEEDTNRVIDTYGVGARGSFSPNSRYLVMGSSAMGKVELFDLDATPEPREPAWTLAQGMKPAATFNTMCATCKERSIVFSPDSQYLVSAETTKDGTGGQASLWRVSDQTLIRMVMLPAEIKGRGAGFVSKGRFMVAMPLADGTATIWEPFNTTSRSLRSVFFGFGTVFANAVSVSPDQTLMAVATEGSLHVFDISDPEQGINRYGRVITEAVAPFSFYSASFSPGGRYLVYAGNTNGAPSHETIGVVSYLDTVAQGFGGDAHGNLPRIQIRGDLNRSSTPLFVAYAPNGNAIAYGGYGCGKVHYCWNKPEQPTPAVDAGSDTQSVDSAEADASVP